VRLTDNFQVGVGGGLLYLAPGGRRPGKRDLSDEGVGGKVSTRWAGTADNINHPWWEARRSHNFGETKGLTEDENSGKDPSKRDDRYAHTRRGDFSEDFKMMVLPAAMAGPLSVI
jgi:hypothetical protein